MTRTRVLGMCALRDLRDMTLDQGHYPYHWAMENNCIKYYPDLTSGEVVMARTQCEQTDGRTNGQVDSYIPP